MAACPWRYDAAAAATGPYQHVFWVGVTGTSSAAAFAPFTLSVR